MLLNTLDVIGGFNMRRCNYCGKIYQKDFKNCPLCGKHTISWEPVTEPAPKPTVVDTIKSIINYLVNMGD